MQSTLLLKNKRVLFVEDEEEIKEQVSEVLEMLFKEVLIANDGIKGYEIYEDELPDIIISDIIMPKMDGIKLTKKIRQTDYETPIILLTACTGADMLVDAANLSVDGYVVKPIDLNILISTLSNAMRRVKKEEGLIQLNENIFYHSGTQELYKDGSLVSLGVKEVELLKLLITNKSETVVKEKISETLWPLESICESAIKNLILRIRKKLGDDMIISVRGIGYRLNNITNSTQIL